MRDLVFTISLKRSTLNLPISTSWPADYPIFRGNCGSGWRGLDITRMTRLGSGVCIAARPPMHWVSTTD